VLGYRGDTSLVLLGLRYARFVVSVRVYEYCVNYVVCPIIPKEALVSYPNYCAVCRGWIFYPVMHWLVGTNLCFKHIHQLFKYWVTMGRETWFFSLREDERG